MFKPKVEIQKSKVHNKNCTTITHSIVSLSTRDVHGENASTRRLLLGFMLLFLVPVKVRGATLQGTVLDPSGQAAPGVRVSLLTPLTALEERQTDAQGRYAFDGLRGGVYKLVASLPGFSSSSTEVEVGETDTRSVDLQLALSAVEEHVVVSASLAGTLAPQIGSSVSVITQQEIDERGAQSVLDVLRGIPGVEINQTGRRGGVTSAFLRGGNSNYNLVMVDGIQVNQFGGYFDFAPLTVDGVDHVEVTRGPESALYGSNAVTGVVNVISKRGEGPAHLTLRAEAGSFTTWRLATGASGLTRGLSWAYNLSRLDSGGVVPNDQYRNQTAFLSLGTRRSPRRQLDFHFFGNANSAGAPGPFGSDPDHLFPGIDRVSRDKQNIFGYQGGYAEQLSARFRQVVSGSISTNDSFFHSPYGDSFLKGLRGVLNTRSEVTVSTRDFLVFGFEYNRDQIKNTFIADAHFKPFLLPRTSLAYFAENRWSPVRRLFVIAGLRVDNLRTRALPPDAFGSRPLLPASSIIKANPRVSVAFLPHEGSAGAWFGTTRLHGSFGTGIRAPDGFELAFTNNPKLKPEKSLSFDTGIEQRFFENRALLDVTTFFNRFRDQIVTLGGSLSNLSTFSSANLANTGAQGLETSFRIRPTPSLEIGAEYTFLDTSILALSGSTLALSPLEASLLAEGVSTQDLLPFRVGQRLLRRPRNAGAYNVTWRHGRLTLNTNAYIRGIVLDVEPNLGTFACAPAAFGGPGLPCLFNNKGYIRANAGFAYQLPGGLELYGQVNNFLNQKYEESFGFPALHLNFLAGFRFNFPAQ